MNQMNVFAFFCQVMELLVHLNKRIKSRPKIQLPVETLLVQYQDPAAASFVTVRIKFLQFLKGLSLEYTSCLKVIRILLPNMCPINLLSTSLCFKFHIIKFWVGHYVHWVSNLYYNYPLIPKS